MNCPICNKELSAVGGIPTIWICNKGEHPNSVKGKYTKYIGDTLATLVELK